MVLFEKYDVSEIANHCKALGQKTQASTHKLEKKMVGFSNTPLTMSLVTDKTV